MKHQALFSSKDKSKKLKCRLLQFLFGALRFESFSFSLGHVTDVETKSETVRPLRDRNFLQGAPSHSVGERRFDIHGVIRECLSLFFEIRNMPGMFSNSINSEINIRLVSNMRRNKNK